VRSKTAALCILIAGIAASIAAVAVTTREQPQAAPRPPEDELWIARDRFAAGAASIAEAGAADLPRALVLGGRIDFDDQRLTHVISPVSGRITRILARLGEEVKRGTPLVAIVSPDVGGAVADELKARADLVAAEHDWTRQQKLYAVQAAAQRDYEGAEDNFRRAKAEEERALQRLALFEHGRVNAVTQEYELPSPIAGRVVASMAYPGLEVQGQYAGGVAAELFTVGSTATVWLYADVAEADLPAVRAGAAVTARVLAYPDRAFGGRIDWVSPALDPQLRSARVRCVLANPDGLLKPQMFASVRIERPPLRALAVPRGAVVRINDQSFVYVAAGERGGGRLAFKRRKIETPNRAGAVSRQLPAASEALLPLAPAADRVQVLAGLAAGERVLVEEPAAETGAGPVDRRLARVALTTEQMRGARIAVEAVDARPVRDVLDVGGRLAFDDLRVAHVFSPVGGRIAKVLAAPGERVRKGAALAVIESPDLGSAVSDVLKAKADLAAAEHEAQRQRELAALAVGVPRDREAADDNYQRAKAEYDRAEQRGRLLRGGGAAATAAAGTVSQSFVLRSPIDGEVTARLANPGLEVQGQYSGGGNVIELFTIGETDTLWLLGDVFEMDLPNLRVGDEVTLAVAAWPGRTFHGAIDWISDALDPVMRTAKVRCVLHNPEHLLRPEMYVRASVSVPAGQRRRGFSGLGGLNGLDGLSVARESLLRQGDETVVFVAAGRTADGRVIFERRPVLAREEQPGGRVPILAGLQPGERVAGHGAIFLLGLL
jgi:cobalt-zinc-cadmium efflux system membrane fusion protein